MHSAPAIAILTAVLLSLNGCAASDPSATASILTPVAASASKPGVAGGYTMSAEELEMDCKHLMGRMQIRILEIRDFNERTTASAAARALQSGAKSVFGGTSSGTDPQGAYARDRAMLNAYNAQLAAKNCKSYDLEAELKPKDFRVSPAATIKPAGKAATGTKAQVSPSK